MKHLTWRDLTLALLVASIILSCSLAYAAQEIVLRGRDWSVAVQPATLQVTAQAKGGAPIPLSAAQPGLGRVQGIKHVGGSLQWSLPDKNANISMQLTGGELSVRIRASKPGSFTWPVISTAKPAKALIWPRWEGCYIPLDNARWALYLIDYGAWNTLEGLTMPFWGVDCGGRILTCIITNPCNNAIAFTKEGSQLVGRFTHEFTANNAVKEYGFVIWLSKSSSPVEPAKQFRQWLIKNGKFVAMREKLKSVPKAERLLGAAQVYLWGDGLLTRGDVYRKQWSPFCRKLIQQSKDPQPSVGKRIKVLMSPDKWTLVIQLSSAQWADNYTTGEIAAELSRLLERTDFYDDASWKEIALPQEASALLARDRSTLILSELCRMNCLLLRAAYPDAMPEVADWGDGVSTKMLKQLQQAGFDRVRLCVGGWEGVEKRPEVAAEADKMGYLFGTYDSFNTIHDPKLRGTEATWPTAQFDAKLYQDGPIVARNGKKLGGFKQTGHLLSPIAARHYVEQRVRENMRKVPYNYYFVDCDAFGQAYDDYSPLHPATQAQDIAARNARLAWIGSTYHVVVGSEGGSSYAAPFVHLVEGVFQPDMGWGDPDLKDKKSPYYLGAYYPPDGPKCFTQQVPLKEQYEFFFYDPRFRLPLYETVFHDSVVATHHWSSASLKFSSVLDTTALTELLYQVPPLYHLNLAEFAKNQAVMKKQYAFFSPLHRELGFARMTDFAWLTPDRMVQRTVFADSVELVSNFTDTPFDYRGANIPARSILALWRGTGAKKTFTPGYAKTK